MTKKPEPDWQPENESSQAWLPEDARFAGLVLVTAALGDVAQELKVVNRRLERLLNVIEEREARTWSIRVKR